MASVAELIHNINVFVQKETEDDQSLGELLPEFEGKEKIEGFVEEFESRIAKLLRRQRKRILVAVNIFVSKNDEELLDALLAYLKGQVFKDDAFAVELSEEATRFLDMSVQEFSKVIMESIDKDIAFEVLSQRSITWIQEWSYQLGEIMRNTSHKAVEKVLVEGIKQGHGIDKIQNALSELPEFNRSRARSTAITEVLTASSVAQQESYAQSPAVSHKKWLHSYAKYSKPRENHLELDGTIVGKFDDFIIPGSEERAQYPRDVRLSPKERIHCHCALSPIVDEAIFALSIKERERIREAALAELNGDVGSTSSYADDKIVSGEFSAIQDVEAWEEEVSQPWINKLTPDELQSINRYTSSDYTRINEYLRATAPTVNVDLDHTIEQIGSGLKKFELTDDIITYRGLRNNIWGLPAADLVGMEFRESGFFSTSIKEGFGGMVQMQVHIPAGAKGAYVNRISEFDNEYEFLLDQPIIYVIKEATEENGVIKIIAEVIVDAK